jgi:bis(5'-nucleosidyl)-tetraphosphatase
MSKKIAAGLILFRKTSEQSPIEYLLLQTSYGKNHWTPPKGHLDEGETELETAIRETKEESNLENNIDYNIIDLDYKIELRYPVEGKEKIVYYWLAKFINSSSGQVKLSDEHIDFKWLDIDKTVELSQFNDMQIAFRKSDEYIRKNGF